MSPDGGKVESRINNTTTMIFFDEDEVVDKNEPLLKVFTVFRRHNLTDEEIANVWNGIQAWLQNGGQNHKDHSRSEELPLEEDEIEID